jgi:hypothetical protein
MASLGIQSRTSITLLNQKASDCSQTKVDIRVIDDSSSNSSCTSMEDRSMALNSPAGLGLSLPQEELSAPRTSSSEARETSIEILDIIFEHALNKFDDSKERLAAGTDKFLSVIDQFVFAGKRIEACLPAFPFKSANKVYKVLGSLPDKAEELALQRLNNMCARIKQIYKPGARVTIISDGITYNGMLITTLRPVAY